MFKNLLWEKHKQFPFDLGNPRFSSDLRKISPVIIYYYVHVKHATSFS